MSEQNQKGGGLIRTPKHLAVAVVLGLGVPIALALLAAQYVTMDHTGKDATEEQVLRRIEPVAKLELASAAAGVAAAKSSEEIYKTVCAACHDSGAAGAPKAGDKAAWAARIGGGLEKLVKSGIAGKGAMPPKGGLSDLSDDDFTRVVAYLANRSGASFKEPAAAVAAPAPQPAAVAAAAPAVVPAAAVAASAPSAAAGKKAYDATCVACHAAGVAGAPKTGDKAAWAPRLAAGADVLIASAIKGKGAMPPKGGNVSLTDADVKAAVEYMTAAVK